MPAYIFTDLLTKASRAGIQQGTREASIWFRNTAQQVNNVQINRLMDDKANLRNKITITDIGCMFMFSYDPKFKETLPYYDRFPLILLVELTGDGFYGLNLHYLPPMLRAKLLDALIELRIGDKYKDNRNRISYQILKGASRFKYFKPCFKKYLYNHVIQRQFLHVETDNWDKALMLPTERFTKATRDVIWKESQEKV